MITINCKITCMWNSSSNYIRKKFIYIKKTPKHFQEVKAHLNLLYLLGLPRSAKYGIILGAGIPGFLCLIGLASFVCGRVRAYGRRRNPNLDFSSAMSIQAAAGIEMGLDRPTIESYPKTVLGESRRLPTSNEGPCPICLAEYQPKDTLRTIPDCNHYFHAHCIDEWLRRNATCPVCRNMPDGSSITTSCSSVSSSSLSSSSSHGTSH